MRFNISVTLHSIMFQKRVGNKYVFAGFACSAFLLQQLSYLLFFPHAESAFLLVSVSFTWQGICIFSGEKTTQLQKTKRKRLKYQHTFTDLAEQPRAHDTQRASSMYLCHGVSTDRFWREFLTSLKLLLISERNLQS